MNGTDAVALGSEDGRTVVVRVASWGAMPLPLEVTLRGINPALLPTEVDVVTLAGKTGGPFEENTPGEPTRIAPVRQTVRYTPGTPVVTLPVDSFTVITITLKASPLLMRQGGGAIKGAHSARL